MSLPQSAPGRAVLADLLPYLRREEQVELVDGAIVQRAIPSFEHAMCQRNLAGLLDPFSRAPADRRGGPGGWWIATEADVHYEKTGDVFRHDLSGWRRETRAERPTGMPVTARPDWACEILSPSSATVDNVKKPRTLHAHGVSHYWVIDPVGGTLIVQRWHADGYIVVLAASRGEVVRAEPFDAVEIAIDHVLAFD